MNNRQGRPKAIWWQSVPGPMCSQEPSVRWLDRKTRLLAIGSCFADNFSRWIALHGVDVLQPGWGLHHNPAAIRDEFYRATGARRPRIIWVERENATEVFLDPLRPLVSADSREEMSGLSDRIDRAAAGAFYSASAMLVTLGLSEVWEQQVAPGNWCPLNVSPPTEVYSPSLHRVRNLRVSEIKSHLRSIISLIRRERGRQIPIVFTISPIPLRATFTKTDIRTANCRSKAALLAAAHEVLDNADKNTHYFPAYEYFWGVQPRMEMWQSDGRHPTAVAIEAVCKEFVAVHARQPQDFASNVDFQVELVS